MRTLIRTNLCPNPNFEVDLSGWAGAGSPAGVISRSTDFSNTKIASAKVDAAAASSGIYITGIPASAGDIITCSAYVLGESGKNNYPEIRFVDAGNVTLTSPGGSTISANGTWQRINQTATAPANTAAVWFLVRNQSAATHTFYVDSVLIEKSSSVGEYFDGSTLESMYLFNKWTGTPNASTSEQYRINSAEGYNPSKALADAKYLTIQNVLGPTPDTSRTDSLLDAKYRALGKVLVDNGIIQSV